MFRRNNGYYKCIVCNKNFELKKWDRYDVVEMPSGGIFGSLVSSSVTYDAFDCSYCGCQNIVNVRKPSATAPEPVEMFKDKTLEEGEPDE